MAYAARTVFPCSQSVVIIAIALLCLFLPCTSSDVPKTFLGGGGPAMSVEELHRELVEADKDGLDAIERVLAPMYATLPKNAHGKLNHATVCYALHRYFVQQHGWFINGMAPDGSGWNGSSTTALMQERTPTHVQRLLEQHLGSRGLSLRELAALASVLHNVVSQQYLGRSEYAYRLAGGLIEGRATEEQFKKAIKMWMAMLIIGSELHLVTSNQIIIASERMAEYFPSWDDLLFWVDDMRQSVAYNQRSRQNPFVGGSLPLEAMNPVVSEVPKQFGQWHDSVCMDLKNKLLNLGRNGRVSLSKFYGAEQHDEDWPFLESVDYLRQLGALDESDPKRLRVIVPNYLVGPNNCLEASPMHTYCCKDECGAIISEVEHGIAAPTGPPGTIVRIVSQISSDTVNAPRNLSVDLTSKLEDVARRHGGRVPLHGRLFAQWMHHAFPNECPHPHVSGTTAPKTPVAFQRSGGTATVRDDERMQHVTAQARVQKLAVDGLEDLSWNDEEELLSYDDPSSRGHWVLRNLLEILTSIGLLLLAALSIIVCVPRSGSLVLGGSKKAPMASEKYMV